MGGGGTSGNNSQTTGSTGSTSSLSNAWGYNFGSNYGSTGSQLYNYNDTLTPWQSNYQQYILPTLYNRAVGGGMTADEEASLWGTAKNEVDTAANTSAKEYARKIATSGISPNSPAVAGGLSSLGSSKISSMQDAAMDFIKTKLSARDTATDKLLTALYTSAPVAVGQYGSYSGTNQGYNTSTSSGYGENASTGSTSSGTGGK